MVSVKQVIDMLIAQGSNVTYRKRSDGGYLITKIDDQNFKGSSGNIAARQMVGASLSEKKALQLQEITPKAKTAASKSRRRGKTKLDEDLQKEIKKTQRIWRKNMTDSKNGRVKTSHIRYIMEHEGQEAAKQALKKIQAYAKGLAYEENVLHLADRIERLTMLDIDENIARKINTLAKKIREMKSNFKEDWINVINNYVYTAEMMAQDEIVEDCIYSICEVIGIDYDSL